MSPKVSGILGLILLPLAFLLFIGTSGPSHDTSPITAAIEPEASVSVKPVVVPHQRAREAAPAPALAQQTLSQTAPAVPIPPNVPQYRARTLPPMPQLVQDAWAQFDAASKARPEASDVESLPRQLFPVSAAVAKVGMAMRQNPHDPSIIAQGTQFFRNCATADSELFSVRAVCLRNYQFWQASSGGDVEMPDVPDEVARIVKVLPPAR